MLNRYSIVQSLFFNKTQDKDVHVDSHLLPTNLLITILFPVLGNPTTATLTLLFNNPLLTLFSLTLLDSERILRFRSWTFRRRMSEIWTWAIVEIVEVDCILFFFIWGRRGGGFIFGLCQRKRRDNVNKLYKLHHNKKVFLPLLYFLTSLWLFVNSFCTGFLNAL